jgi:hypothetical protein
VRHPTVPLKVIPPTTGPSLCAPPILVASTHTIDYTCGGCGTVLIHAEIDQIYNLIVRCTKCETFNSTDI